ncbi:Acetyl-coenzyme A synthetase [Nitrospina gracilis 3/211]|uniref:Acetyl-coenzyme A synthetase n=1 Tax=Nitrospina gracilis (strain 3/211) TaxID=1266370 RepID=M1Z0Z1_NITG3|nr:MULTISPECIES: acetate--CoA ligase [Nitrospina]MCF8724481.1 acetyl-CoA synthetase [Nitrospina sp. Nb-3]CCQ91644.1 Acetyl-coenzyme A synthetase [Nitrospina gracilis 3/211]
MSGEGWYTPPESLSKKAWVQSMEQYREMYDRSINDPEGFWAEQAEEFFWYKKWDKVWDYNYNIKKGKIFIEWFKGAKTNITVNCIDRHLETRGDQTAIIWEGNEPDEDSRLTYRELHAEVCRFANVLKKHGAKKGDRISIYMPMIPELAIAMLACARIGAIHSIVFGGFSPTSLADRIVDSGCSLLVTTDGAFRGKKPVPLKENADQAMEMASKQGTDIKQCIVVERVGSKLETAMKDGRDFWWHDEMKDASPECEPEQMDAEDPLFILYTSGSTGKPKGAQHNVGGYMLFNALTHKYIFDYHDGDIWWCTADIGWVTGHSYIIYGPLANGATTIMFEGIPTYPDAGRFWAVIDKHKVTQFYTAPTAIRALISHGEDIPAKYDLSTLKVLGSVGEPINPEAWRWYHKNIGRGRCPVVDTWWQTETGGILISPLPGATPCKPGSATLPFFGVVPVVIEAETGKVVEGNDVSGVLALAQPWPGQMRTVFGDHSRFEENYFQMYPGYYFTGDGCRRDKDGYYWVTGRVDDVINVSGHRIGTAEVESALVLHDKVAEAAVVGFPHDIKGQGIYAYVTLMDGVEYKDDLKKVLIDFVRKEIGPIAAPDIIHWAPGLPKTRSGKIMRRILRKIAANEGDQLGDTSTLADPSVVDQLKASYKKI